ncbi:MAG: CotH kinase family protein, partial [Clostridia bacterium]|nr:CotH kinase family protein [Clostridia bacterium]
RQKQIEYIRQTIAEAYDALASGSREKVEKLIDLDSLLAVYLVEETVLNLDSQWDGFYMYKDTDGKLTFGPIWDFDLTMGNADDGSDNPRQIFVGNGKGSGNSYDSWFGLAMSASWFREMVAEKWAEVYDSFVQMPAYIRDEAELGMESYLRNFEKWPIFGQKQNRETEAILQLRSFPAQTEYLADWLTTRIDWLNELFRDPSFVTDGKGLDAGIVKRNLEVEAEKSVLHVRDNYYVFTKYVDLSSLEAPDGFPGEGAENLFDNDKHTKYCTDAQEITVTFRLKEAKALSGYMLRTANDTAENPARNPDSWTIRAGHDGQNWETLFVTTEEPDLLYNVNYGWFGFTLDNDTAYEWYSFTFTEPGTFQLSELWLGEAKS